MDWFWEPLRQLASSGNLGSVIVIAIASAVLGGYVMHLYYKKVQNKVIENKQNEAENDAKRAQKLLEEKNSELESLKEKFDKLEKEHQEYIDANKDIDDLLHTRHALEDDGLDGIME